MLKLMKLVSEFSFVLNFDVFFINCVIWLLRLLSIVVMRIVLIVNF